MQQTSYIHNIHSFGFNAFKYIIYSLLIINVALFFNEEWLATNVTFASGLAFRQIFEGFAATIDTAAWVVLILLFELETYVLDDKRLKGFLTWVLHGLRMLCYLIIIYAFLGYFSKVVALEQYTVSMVTDLCNVPMNWQFMTSINEFVALTADNCSGFAATGYMESTLQSIISDNQSYKDTMLLAWVDVINAGTWLLICALLEIDVRIQLANATSSLRLRVSSFFKVLLYSVIFGAAIYWGYEGELLDFWDAFLWLVAFFIIELNLFDWQTESLERESQLEKDELQIANLEKI